MASGRGCGAARTGRRREGRGGWRAVSFAPARLDLTARALTGAFFCALSLAVLLALTGPVALIGLAAAMAGIAAGCALLAPRAYVIEDGGLTVRRVLGAGRVEGPLRLAG